MTNAAGYITSMPREQQDRAGKIRMFPSGRYVDPFDLKPEDIRVDDIAHHLAIINRYTGGSPFPVSVAYHAVRVCNASVNVKMIPQLSLEDQLRAHIRRLAHLHHDDGEAYLNDLASPVKKKPGMEVYKEAHDRAERVIFGILGIPFELMAETKPLDDADFRREVTSFYEPQNLQPGEVVQEISWRQAERMFIELHDSIVLAIRTLKKKLLVDADKWDEHTA